MPSQKTVMTLFTSKYYILLKHTSTHSHDQTMYVNEYSNWFKGLSQYNTVVIIHVNISFFMSVNVLSNIGLNIHVNKLANISLDIIQCFTVS